MNTLFYEVSSGEQTRANTHASPVGSRLHAHFSSHGLNPSCVGKIESCVSSHLTTGVAFVGVVVVHVLVSLHHCITALEREHLVVLRSALREIAVSKISSPNLHTVKSWCKLSP